MSTTKAAQTASEPFQPVAALLAFAFPGLGHWYLGYRDRAVCIAGGVLGLFLTGMLVGGIDVVDRQEDPIWFIGQALVGPVALGVDYLHQHHFKVYDSAAQRVRSARPDEYRDPTTGRPEPISSDSTGKTWVTLGPGRIISPAYPPKVRSVGKIHDIGTLFGAIAGMMNLICVIDAAFRARAAPVRRAVQIARSGASGPTGAREAVS